MTSYFLLTCIANSGRGVYSRAASIRGRRLFEGGVYSRKYGKLRQEVWHATHSRVYISTIKLTKVQPTSGPSLQPYPGIS